MRAALTTHVSKKEKKSILIKMLKVVVAACLLLVLLPSPVRSADLEQLAKDVCQAMADSFGSKWINSGNVGVRVPLVYCYCYDTKIVPGQGANLCGYSKALGDGLQVDATFDKWTSGNFPQPISGILSSQTCDARHGALTCSQTQTGERSYSTTTSLSISTGFEASIGSVAVPSLGEASGTISLSVDYQRSYTATGTLSSSATCGPPPSGQPEGTCSVYKVQWFMYALAGGLGFTYTAKVKGGVMMHFDPAVDMLEKLGHPTDGSTHFYWYFPIPTILDYAKKTNIASDYVQYFDPPASDGSIAFHGSGVVTDSIVASSTCSAGPCS